MKRFIFCGFLIFIALQPAGAQTEPLATIVGPVATDFGTYTPYTVDIEPNAAQYTVASDFSNVTNFSAFSFSAAERDYLRQNYFVVIPERDAYATGYKEIYDIYNEAREQSQPQFVTTDAVLHVFHKFYDKLLMTAEVEHFFQDLTRLDSTLFRAARARYDTTGDAFLQACLQNIISYFSVPLSILKADFTIPAMVADTVNLELDYITGQQGYLLSPLFTAYMEDYSQYKPRGHYTLSDSLHRYFKAMMWHGRQTYTLHNDLFVPNPGIPRPDLTGAALAVLHIMENLPAADHIWELWNHIYVPTVFFVGKADDILPQDYLNFAREYFGADFAEQSLETIINEDTLLDFITAAHDHFPAPQITTNTPKGMRLMGQRFIPDSYMLDQLVYPFVPDRLMPKSLDVLAAMHSAEAYALLDEMGATDHLNYITQLTYLKNLCQEYPDEQWAENLYWNWLYCLMPLLIEKGGGFPPFMQNLAWLRKDINTALGSWTELRHDTILYAKQSTTEYIGMDPANKITQGYVEPNPYLFARLAALSKLMREGLLGLALLNPEMEAKLNTLEELLLDLKGIAEKELTRRQVSMAEYKTILNFGQTITELLTFADHFSGSNGPSPDGEDTMPVIADVHTDSNTETCLEEAVGYPAKIYVITQIENELRVTVGGVFTYYEFIQPIADRLTDEEWRTLLQSGNEPDFPGWTAAFMAFDSSYVNDNPDYYYTQNSGFFAFEYAFSDSTPQIGDSVTVTFELLGNYLYPYPIYLRVENQAIDPFVLELERNDDLYYGTFATGAMSPGKIFITFVDSVGTYYQTHIGLSSTGIQDDQSEPVAHYALYHNYPNPFNPTTTIRYHLAASGFVELSVYSVTGQLIETLVQEYKNAGDHQVRWHPQDVSSGIYFYKLQVTDPAQSGAGEYQCVQKCVLIR